MADQDRVIKNAKASGIKRYSPGELKLLAAEGRLKGNNVGALTNLRRPQNSGDAPVSPSVFARNATRQACWTDPARLLETFLDLCRIRSPSNQEGRVTDFLRTRLDAVGCQTRVDAVGNLIADLPATSDTAPNLMFTAHMDCAYPGGDAPVQPILYRSGDIGTDGRNSLGADDKSGIAGILAAVEYITGAKLPRGEIRIVFTVQEELGWRGIKQIPANILNGIHLVFAMDVPVRVERDETSFMAVLHLTPGHPFDKLAHQSARKVAGDPLILYAEDGFVGGDTICISPLGAIVIDLCAGSRYAHTTHEHIRFGDLTRQTSWLIAMVEDFLKLDKSKLDMRTVYGDEPIGHLTGVRKQIPLTPDFLRDRIKQARTIHTRPGPEVAQALMHLSAVTPRAGDPELLAEVVQAYRKCLRVDQVPQVQRALTSSLAHLATNLADVRPLTPLIQVATELVEQGGDEAARVQAVRFLEELYGKERRVATRTHLVRTLVLFLQTGSTHVRDAVIGFFRSNLDDTIHALTLAFCNRDRAGWERTTNTHTGRVVDARSRNTAAGWSLIRQRILQLLLEEDRLLPEMLDWIFTHDGSATQKIAVGYIDPTKTTRIADRILRNLRSREKGVQETAIHFVGSHRMEQAITPLIDLLLTPYTVRNRSLIEWALDAIGMPALDDVINRLGGDSAYDEFVRRMFNRHDQATDTDFDVMQTRLRNQYGDAFSIEDITQVALLSHYLNEPDLRHMSTLSRWNKRRTIVFYDLLRGLYPERDTVERLFETLDENEYETRPYFVRMAIQKNLFDDPNLLALIANENARFLENFVRLENQIPQPVILSRLREFTAGAQLDMADPQDVEIYYLYLLKQSPRMPDRSRYLDHIAEAQKLLFPPMRDYCNAFSITGDRIEEVGTVDRDRIRNLIQALPNKVDRKERLQSLILESDFPKREKNRLINGLSEALGVDVSEHSTIQDRTHALMETIDFEFDSAYRPVPQVVFPILLRIRMKHRNDAVFGPLADYALEFAMINNPEIPESFDSGEVDLVLDALNDLLTDRVFEAEKELSDDVFPELLVKHKQAWAQFYEAQWKGIIKRLRPHAKDERERELIDQTETTMLEYDTSDDESAAQLDTNLTRLVSVIRPQDRDLITFHARHRECYKVYDAVLRVRNLRQLKRIYREVYLVLQDEISYASREHAEVVGSPSLPGGDEPVERVRSAISKEIGYLKYARKELGKIGKLMADFVLERALADRVATVRSEITKLRQIVVGTSQILCVPCKDVSIIYRSWPGNDCNTGDMKQIMNPDCSFFKIISEGVWKGYFTVVELRRRNERAFLLDVLNFSGLKMDNEGFVKVLMHQIVQIAKAQGIKYLLTSPTPGHISNRDYIRSAVTRVFPAQGTVQSFGLPSQPTAYFQSLQANLNVIWENEDIEEQ